MLFNVLAVIVILYLLIMPLFVMEFIKFGIRLSSDSTKAAKAESTIGKIVRSNRKKPEISPETQRSLDILANIDAYDGTELGQKEIK